MWSYFHKFRIQRANSIYRDIGIISPNILVLLPPTVCKISENSIYQQLLSLDRLHNEYFILPEISNILRRKPKIGRILKLQNVSKIRDKTKNTRNLRSFSLSLSFSLEIRPPLPLISMQIRGISTVPKCRNCSHIFGY